MHSIFMQQTYACNTIRSWRCPWRLYTDTVPSEPVVTRWLPELPVWNAKFTSPGPCGKSKRNNIFYLCTNTQTREKKTIKIYCELFKSIESLFMITCIPFHLTLFFWSNEERKSWVGFYFITWKAELN